MKDLPNLGDKKAWAQWLYDNAPGYVCDAILGEVTTSTSRLRKWLSDLAYDIVEVEEGE